MNGKWGSVPLEVVEGLFYEDSTAKYIQVQEYVAFHLVICSVKTCWK